MKNSQDLLTTTLQRLMADPDDRVNTVHDLVVGLTELRGHLPTEQWRTFATVTCREHPLFPVIQHDPLTRAAYEKARGYAGDADCLDIMYAAAGMAQSSAWDKANEVGQVLASYTTKSGAARAVQERARFIASRIDRTCEANGDAALLSVACGHLREAGLATTVGQGRFGRFDAIDSDPQTIAVVEREHGPSGIAARRLSVATLLAGGTLPARYDLIYSLGLYDYLSEAVAQRLTHLLAHMLKVGGSLIVANFLPTTSESGFMESFMDWWLTYRSEHALRRLVLGLSLPCEVTTYADDAGQIAYLEVRREN